MAIRHHKVRFGTSMNRAARRYFRHIQSESLLALFPTILARVTKIRYHECMPGNEWGRNQLKDGMDSMQYSGCCERTANFSLALGRNCSCPSSSDYPKGYSIWKWDGLINQCGKLLDAGDASIRGKYKQVEAICISVTCRQKRRCANHLKKQVTADSKGSKTL